MFFKALEMQGFKSFADKIRLEFTPGVTAIVGPNGSGKSNISDAMRWVMGEMSAKTLRGSKMEDVIFAGTQKRGQLGFAEVTIIMDNSDRTLNIDFAEVSITRKVYRSGESEYYINKAQCRLKDIHELLMDTGLGRDGYSIVGQGKIDEILSAKSEERRSVFDEAAGITKYRYRKEEAERKLNLAEENLCRVNDIITEIEDRLEPLKNQSEKAKKYLIFKEELKTLEINVWLENVDKFKAQLAEAEESYKGASTNLENAKITALKTEQDLHSLRENARVLDSEVDSLKAGMFSAKNDTTRFEGEISLLESRIEANKNNSQRLQIEKETSIEKKNRLEKELEERILERKKLEDALELSRFELEKINKKEVEYLKSIDSNKIQNRVKEDELAKKRQELSGIQAKKEAAGQFVENLKDRATEFSMLLAENNDKLEQAQIDLSEVKTVFNEAKTQASSVNVEDDQIIIAMENNYTAKKRDLDSLNNRIEATKNKKHILEELENEYEGYPKSIKAVMNEHRFGSLKNRVIYGTLSRILNVQPEYITALEAVLGAAMQNIVTETEDDAKAAIEFLKAGARGRATFLPVSSVKGRVLEEKGLKNCKGFLGMAYELVGYEMKFEGIIKSLLGRTAVVDTMENAIAIARKFSYNFRIVTLQGEVLNAGGSITGGSVHNQAGALSRTSEIATLEKEVLELEKKAKERSKALEKLLKELENSRLEEEKRRNEYIELQSRLYKLKAEYDTGIMTVKSLEASGNKLKSDLDLVKTQITQADLATAEMVEYIAQLNNEINLSETNMCADSQNYSEMELTLEQLREQVFEQRLGLASIEKDIEVAIQSATRLKGEISEGNARVDFADNQIIILKEQSNRMIQEIAQKQEQVQSLKQETEKQEGLIEQVVNQKLELEKNIDTLESQNKLSNEEMFTLQGEFGRLEARKAKLETEMDSLVSRLWEEYELTYSTALAHKMDVGGIAKAHKRINELKADIRALGSVNVDSIEEYKIVSERYTFLTVQRDDLKEAKENLNKLIEDMTLVMQKQFKENFEILNKKFGETFVELFGGGRGELRLANPVDVLKSGIEIDIQPPGKKLQSITLLSGGEKAFTAIALLFAILKIRPVFFCIFDEIEAALDDQNVFKFADYIKEYSTNTQFILITHRKGTMESANTLYGVTMQEKGVSKLLALELDNITA